MHQIKNPFNQQVIYSGEFTGERECSQKLNQLVQGKSQLRPFERSAILRGLSVLIKDNSEALARQITIEMGKPITESRGEIERAIHTAEFGAECARNRPGMAQNSDERLILFWA